MLRISRLTDYATVLLAALAGEPERVQTAASLAAQTHIAGPTVSKLLKQLQRAGLVSSTRGLHGGYQLARPATQISAAAIPDAPADAGARYEGGGPRAGTVLTCATMSESAKQLESLIARGYQHGFVTEI